MKVCFVTDIYPPDFFGGPGEVVFNLQKFFLEQGIEAYVFTCGKTAEGYPKTIRTYGGKRLFHVISPLYFKNIKQGRFDILNFHGLSGMGIAPIMLFDQASKVITTLHSEELREDRATQSIKIAGSVIARPSLRDLGKKYFFGSIKLLGIYMDLAISERIIAVSEKTKEDFLLQKQVKKDRITVINNGVDIEKFSPNVSGDFIRETYSLRDSLIILTIAGNILIKGTIFAVFAFKEIIQVLPKAKLIIVGVTDKNKERLSGIINNLGIKDNIILVKNVPNCIMPLYYSAADVVLVPSLSENFPVVVLEAMSSGKPVIASAVGGIPELVNNNKNGILVRPGNVEQIVEALFCLLENSSLRRKMGVMGRRIVEEKYSWKKIGNLYLREFEMLI